MMVGMDPAARDTAELRLQLLELLCEAIEHRDEVLDIMATSVDRAEAHARIVARFDVAEPVMAGAVLDLQLSRFTHEARSAIAQDAAELRAELAQDGGVAT